MAKEVEYNKSKSRDKAANAIKKAGLSGSDSTISGLRKLDKAMSREFGEDFELGLEPLGITLSEKVPANLAKLEITATGTIKCTFSPWSCGPDVDF